MIDETLLSAWLSEDGPLPRDEHDCVFLPSREAGGCGPYPPPTLESLSGGLQCFLFALYYMAKNPSVTLDYYIPIRDDEPQFRSMITSVDQLVVAMDLTPPSLVLRERSDEFWICESLRSAHSLGAFVANVRSPTLGGQCSFTR
jgi:hypothetical protein